MVIFVSKPTKTGAKIVAVATSLDSVCGNIRFTTLVPSFNHLNPFFPEMIFVL